MSKEFPADEQYSVLEAPNEGPAERNPALPLDDPADAGPPPAESTTDESESSEIDESLIVEAKSYGLSEDDLAGMDADRINATLAAIDRRAVEMIERQRMQGQPPQRGFGQQQPPFMQQPGPMMGMQPGAPWASQPAQQPGAFPPNQHMGFQQQQPGQQFPAQPQGFQPFELKVTEADGWDPELVKTLRAMNEHYQQQFGGLNQSLQAQRMWYEQQMSSLQQQQEAQFTAWFDGKVSELGEAYQSVFGKGRGESLRMGSGEHNARLQLVEAMNKLSGLYPQASDDELFTRALRMEFGHVSQQLQRQALSDRLKNRSRQTIGRPGQKGRPSTEVNPQTGLPQSLHDDVDLDIQRMMQQRQGA